MIKPVDEVASNACEGARHAVLDCARPGVQHVSREPEVKDAAQVRVVAPLCPRRVATSCGLLRASLSSPVESKNKAEYDPGQRE